MIVKEIIKKAKELGLTRQSAADFLAENMPRDLEERKKLLHSVLNEADLAARAQDLKIVGLIVEAGKAS
ncbi:MAG: hypothetical protein PHT40_00375 [Patescibacteria group bacterium]|nr:hypothetical protein [Patescibacteria group bacterium]